MHVVPRGRRHYLLVGDVHGQPGRQSQVPERLEAARQHQKRTQRVRGGEHRLEGEHAFHDENTPGQLGAPAQG